MKKAKNILVALFVASMLALTAIWHNVRAQTEDNQLVDAIQADEIQQLEELQTNLEFSQFESCVDMETVLSEYLKIWKKYNKDRPVYRYYEEQMLDGDMIMTKEMAVPVATNSMVEEDAAADSLPIEETISSSNTDFSTTNNQKKNVDEPEIIKTNGDYIFYYNRQEHKISIVKSPLDLDNSTITLSDVEIKTVINLPGKFQWIQLFVQEDRLVILGTRYIASLQQKAISRNQRTSVAVYDISHITKPELLKFIDLDGYYRNSRMINDKLYILSQMDINRRYINDNPSILKESKASAQAIEFKDSSLEVVTADCNKISYILPNEETIKQTGMHPQFTLISVIDIQDTDKQTQIHTLLANAWEIHMSENSLYIAQNLRFSGPSPCPLWSRCIMPIIQNGQYTLLHKFDIDGMDLDYSTSNIVPGNILTQYSMDEDKNWNFRILTAAGRREGTNLYVLDKKFKTKWSITEIQPDEQFKSSRYIWDKLYLVTFQQTDPLFVIDIADISDPKIVWELKIPGFSTYLHPMWDLEDDKQYLIWLWYSANQYGRQDGLQVSLYQVDYAAKETASSKCSWLDIEDLQDEYNDCLSDVDTDNIRISMIDSKSFGDASSFSQAMTNPRMFVIDANNVVTLPMVLNEKLKTWERCSSTTDVNGTIIEENCYDMYENQPTFAWLKSLQFDAQDGISEKNSLNYLSLFQKLYQKDNKYFNTRNLRDLAMRVGFAGDSLYFFNNDFAHFVVPWAKDGKYIFFDKDLD